MTAAGRRAALGWLAAGLLPAAAYTPPGAAAEPPSAAAPRERERTALLRQGDAALAQGRVDAATQAFERAGLIAHAADAELGLVRAAMQAGHYRQALAFAAHTAGVHHDETAGAALYAWLLAQGGQDAVALRLLDTALQAAPADPLLLATRRALQGPAQHLPAVLLAPPLRLAPYATGSPPPPGARVVASGTLIDTGRHALVPLAALAPGAALWLRNGLGQTVQASVLRRVDSLGLGVLKLQRVLASTAALAPRDPFPGSPGYAVAFSPAPHAGAAWPRLHSGFYGLPDASGEQRKLGIALPPGPHGGPVFDAAGRLAGIALPGANGVDRVLLAGQLRPRLGSLLGPAGAVGPRAALDEVYESALGTALQLIALR